MKNTILNYDETLSGTNKNNHITAQDYTSKYFRQLQLLKELKDSELVEHLELTDNQTIEQVSYILYDTADYWDILVLINNIDPIFDMVYNFDIVSDVADAKLEKYYDDFSVYINQTSKDRLREAFLKEEVKKNEDRRTIKVIKPTALSEFIKILVSLDFTDIDSVQKRIDNNQ